MQYETIQRVNEARASLEAKGKRGSKVTTAYSIEDLETEVATLVTTLRLLNVRGREVDQIVLHEPAIATGVRSPWDGSTVACRDCAGTEFYSVGRCRTYNNWVCAACGRATSTLTETGMCQ